MDEARPVLRAAPAEPAGRARLRDRERDSSLLLHGGSPGLPRRRKCRDPHAYRNTLAKISPVNYVAPGQTLPPFLLLHGDADDVVACSDSERMYALLTIVFDFIGRTIG